MVPLDTKYSTKIALNVVSLVSKPNLVQTVPLECLL